MRGGYPRSLKAVVGNFKTMPYTEEKGDCTGAQLEELD
jgi:hypothetical protein